MPASSGCNSRRCTPLPIEDLDLPGYRLHLLKAADKGRWSIWVNGNWRLTFAFRNGHAFDLDFEDYL